MNEYEKQMLELREREVKTMEAQAAAALCKIAGHKRRTIVGQVGPGWVKPFMCERCGYKRTFQYFRRS